MDETVAVVCSFVGGFLLSQWLGWVLRRRPGRAVPWKGTVADTTKQGSREGHDTASQTASPKRTRPRKQPTIPPRGLEDYGAFLSRVMNEPILSSGLVLAINTHIASLGTMPRPSILYALHATLSDAMGRLSGDRTHDLRVLTIAEVVQSAIVDVHLQPLPTRRSALFFPDRGSYQLLLSFLAGAQRCLDVCVYTITDRLISEQLVKAHERGVAVRIITCEEPPPRAHSLRRGRPAQGPPARPPCR